MFTSVTTLMKKLKKVPAWAYILGTFATGVAVQAIAPDSGLSSAMALAFIAAVSLWVMPTGLKVVGFILKLILSIVLIIFWIGVLAQVLGFFS